MRRRTRRRTPRTGLLGAVAVAAAVAASAGSSLAGSGPPPVDRLAPPAAPAGKTRPPVADGSVVVRFVPGASAEARSAALADAGATSTASLAPLDEVRVRTDGTSVGAALAALRGNDAVASAQPDFVRKAFDAPNDPLYVSGAQANLDAARLPAAWSTTHGSSSVVIAVLDTGVDLDHPDLAGKLLPGKDFINRDDDPSDDNGHGTMVAGVAAASTGNGRGIAGAGWDARILPVKVLDARGEGTDWDIAEGIVWAVDHGANVINMSFGGPEPGLGAAVAYAHERGVVVVAAAGNEASDLPTLPAALPGVIAVSATDDDGAFAWFSSYGRWVDVAAPGIQIASTARADGPAEAYASGSGTSFAAPLVSGIAALVLAAHPGWSPDQVISQIDGSAHDLGPRGVDPYYGYGEVDAAAALGAPVQPPAPPAVDSLEPNDAASRAAPVGGGASGTISPEGDEDWYSFDASSSGWFDVTVTPPAAADGNRAQELDPWVEVYDSALHLVAQTDNGGAGDAEHALAPAAAAGRYFVVVGNDFGSRSPGSYSISVAPAPAPAGFAPYISFRTGSWPEATAVVDVNGDGYRDVLVTTGYYYDAAHDLKLEVFPGSAGGLQSTPTLLPTDATYGDAMGLAVGDLDGDGKPDAAVATSAGLDVYYQRGGLTGPTLFPLRSSGPGATVTIADVDGDGRNDVLMSNADGLFLLANNGVGFAAPTALAANAWTRVVAGDVTGDGRTDVVGCAGGAWICAGPATLFARTAAGTYTQRTLTMPDGGGAWALDVGDVTGDGAADVVAAAGSLDVFPQLVDGSLGRPATYPSYEHAGAVAIADLNNDRRKDVAVVHEGWRGVGEYEQLPSGALAAEVVFQAGFADWYNAEALSAGDFTGDGRADLALADYNDGVELFRSVGDASPPAGTGGTPFVVDDAPADGATDVPTTVAPSLTFGWSQPEESTAVTLRNARTGEPVKAARTWDANGTRLTLTPQSALAPATPYVVDVTSWDFEYTFSFRFRTSGADATSTPETTIDAGPSGTVYSVSASFAFSSAAPGATFTCALDGGEWVPCASPQTYGLLSLGTHTFRVRATDPTGAADPTPAVRTWTVGSSEPPPPNDAFANAAPLAPYCDEVRGTLVAATKEPGEPMHAGYAGGHSVWYVWTAPASGPMSIGRLPDSHLLIAVYTGSSVTSLTPVAQDDPAPRGTTEPVTFDAKAGTTYRIAVDGYAGATGLFMFQTWLTDPAGRPFNDDFASAFTLSGARGHIVALNDGATKEPGEPDHAGQPGGASVWWRWTAATSGTVTFDTAGTDWYMPIVAVYTGTSVSALTPVAAAKQQYSNEPIFLSFAVTAGTTYDIAVDGGPYGDSWVSTARFHLNWDATGQPARPPNDDFANATPLLDSPAGVGGEGDTSNATLEPGEPQAAGPGGHSLWFRWTPAESGTTTIDTELSSIDTTLAVYTGPSLATLTTVAANDDVPGGWTWSRVTVSVSAGTPYWIQIDGARGASGRVRFEASAPSTLSPPANDDFASAFPLQGRSGVADVDTRLASREPGEPTIVGNPGGHSVWYAWTAPQTASVIVRMTRANFDTTLAVYTGSFVTALTKVAEDDDGGGGGLSEIVFQATAGTAYRFQVDGYDGRSGDPWFGFGVLEWSVPPPPTNDAFATPDVIPRAGGGGGGDTTAATREPGEPTIAGNRGGHSVWWSWTPELSGRASVDTNGSEFDTTLAVYTGSSLGTLTKVAENDDASGTVTTSLVSFDATAGQTYRIQVDGYAGTTRPPWYGRYGVTVTAPSGGTGTGGTVPANDAFANAAAFSTASVVVTGDTTRATREAAEPLIVGNAGGRSVWFSWTPPSSGRASVDTHGSSFDTTLAVYTGSSVAALSKVAENDDSGTDTTSALSFNAVAGTTYRIQLDGYYGTSRPPWYGPYTLSFAVAAAGGGGGGGTVPSNDAFAAAHVVPAGAAIVTGDTTGATRETGEPTIAGNPGGHSVWFAWTPSAAGAVTVDTHGSSFDTTLAVYTGSSLGALTKVVENDDASGTDTTSTVAFTAAAGTTYRIQLDGYNGTSRPPWYGTYTLNVTPASAPPPPPPQASANDAFAAAQALGGASGAIAGDTTSATRESGEPTIVGNPGGHSVWFAWTAPASGSVTVDTRGSAFDTTLAVYTGSSLAALTKVAEDDDSPTDTTSVLTFAATAGTTYRFQLDGYNGTSHPPWYGAYTLSWATR